MSTRTTRRSARLAAVGLTLAAALGLAACSPAEAGAAAIVGDRTVSVQDLQDAVHGIRTGNPDLAGTKGLDRYVLFDLLAAPYLLEAASSAGMGVSSSEAAAALPKAHEPDPHALTALQAQLAFQKLLQAKDTDALKAVQQQLSDAGVRVNPRFGRYDPAGVTDPNTPTIGDEQPNWLVPSPTPTASAPPTAP